MKIVVFIPAYNSDPKELKRTLDSIAVQTRKPDLVWVVDNASDIPLGQNLMDEYQDKFRIHVTRQAKTITRVQNWNDCLDFFMHSYVPEKDDSLSYLYGHDAMKFVFVGDTLDPICLEEQEKFLTEETPIVTSSHRVKRLPMSYNMHQFPGDKIITPKESLLKSAADGNWIAGSTACPLFHKSVLGDLRFREDLEWASDWMFWTQLSEKGNVAFIYDVLVNFHMDSRQSYKKLSGSLQAAKEETEVNHYILNKLNAYSGT